MVHDKEDNRMIFIVINILLEHSLIVISESCLQPHPGQKMTSPFFFLILLSTFLVTQVASLTPEQELLVNEAVEEGFMAYNRIPGVGLAIVENNGEQVFAKGYGFEDVEAPVSASDQTKFCIASISKTFTATLTVKVLSEKFPELGHSVLDVPIRSLHPTGNFTFSDRYRAESMSFRDLLSHRHGIKTESLGSSAGAYGSMDEYLYRSRYAKETGPYRAHGEYSNTYYVLIGRLIEEIAGVPYETLLQDLFDQIGMTGSSLIQRDTDYDNFLKMSKGYYLKDDQVLKFNMSLINRIFLGGPAGGIISNPQDMSKYMAFHLNLGRVDDNQIIPVDVMNWLKQSTFALDMINFKTNSSEAVSGVYALGTGFQLAVIDGWRYNTHSGQYTPFMSEMRIYPDLHFGTFTIANGPVNTYDSEFGHPDLHNAIFKILMGQMTEDKLVMPLGTFTPKNPASKNKQFQYRKDVKDIRQEVLPGVYGHPVEGELEILSQPNGTLYLAFGTWARGPLTTYPDVPNGFLINWDTDLVQEIYFGAGSLIDMIAQFVDENTVLIYTGEVHEFKRDLTLPTLPDIPWSEGSCGPEN